jgi:fucose permease
VLPAFALSLGVLVLARGLPSLVVALFLTAVLNSVVDVAMNAHGVAVERRYGRPILSSLHAMHPLGGMVGAGIGALVARLAIGTAAHFLFVAGTTGVAAIAATRLLLPASVDVSPTPQGVGDRVGVFAEWLRGWSRRAAVLGVLALCITLAEGAALNWCAVYLRDTLGASQGLAALGVTVFLAGVTLGRLAGDGLVRRFGPVASFRAGGSVAAVGFGAGLLVGTPVAGIVGVALLGAGLSYLLPLLFSAAGRLPGEATAAVVARVSTLGYLGSFVGPALIGSLAGVVGLASALVVPAVLVAATALSAKVVASD